MTWNDRNRIVITLMDWVHGKKKERKETEYYKGIKFSLKRDDVDLFDLFIYRHINSLRVI